MTRHQSTNMKLAFFSLCVFSLLAFALYGQAPAPVAKSSPASDALIAAAKEMKEEQKAFDTALTQARSSFDISQKSLLTQIQEAQKDLNDKVKADKKYAPLIEKISTLQKQGQDLQQHAQTQFAQSANPLQSKIASDKALIEGLIPVVRKENGFPDNAAFDPATQNWSVPKAVEKVAEPKK
jgi:hypothetical protein